MAKDKTKDKAQQELLPGAEGEGRGAEGVGKETFLPEGEKLPGHYIKLVDRPRYPCPHCRRITDKYGQQAATVLSSPKDVVQLRCRCCGYRWDLPVKKAE